MKMADEKKPKDEAEPTETSELESDLEDVSGGGNNNCGCGGIE